MKASAPALMALGETGIVVFIGMAVLCVVGAATVVVAGTWSRWRQSPPQDVGERCGPGGLEPSNEVTHSAESEEDETEVSRTALSRMEEDSLQEESFHSVQREEWGSRSGIGVPGATPPPLQIVETRRNQLRQGALQLHQKQLLQRAASVSPPPAEGALKKPVDPQ
eukprot:RCo037904